jgi:Secretion system C-terminal sorting domain
MKQWVIKSVCICVFLAGLCLQTHGQTVIPFGVTPSAVLIQTIPSTGANEVWIYFPNISQDSITLTWRRVAVNQPAGWEIDLCDYGACIGGIPSNGTMNLLGPQDSAYLKLIVQPKGIEAEAILDFRVALATDPSLYHDVQFRVKTNSFTSTQAIDNISAIVVFPNPVREQLKVDTKMQAGVLQIRNAQGVLLEEQVVQQDIHLHSFDFQKQPTGFYYLTLQSTTGIQSAKIIKQ